MTDKSISAFKASIRAAARGLWASQIDHLDFADAMFSALRRGFEQAWQEGAMECGILPHERTKEEQDALNLMLGENMVYVPQFADFIFANRKSEGGKLGPIMSRAELWVNRYNEVKGKAQLMACADKKWRWMYDGGEHCRTCLKLNGRIARGSMWKSKNVHPGVTNGKLKCGGYNCKCTLVETKDPVTRGRWPNLP